MSLRVSDYVEETKRYADSYKCCSQPLEGWQLALDHISPLPDAGASNGVMRLPSDPVEWECCISPQDPGEWGDAPPPQIPVNMALIGHLLGVECQALNSINSRTGEGALTYYLPADGDPSKRKLRVSGDAEKVFLLVSYQQG